MYVWLLGQLYTTAVLVCEELEECVGPLELEFQVIISHSVGAGTPTGCSARVASAHDHCIVLSAHHMVLLRINSDDRLTCGLPSAIMIICSFGMDKCLFSG